MKKISLILSLVLLLALAVVPLAMAGGPTPAGNAAGPKPERSGKPVNLATIPEGEPFAIYMVDGWYCWDLTATRDGNHVDLVGVVHVDWDWNATGSATVAGGVVSDGYLRADNPFADGCLSGYTDWFEYFGGGPRTAMSGSWTSYCSGEPYNSGTWYGAAYKGTCP